MVQRQDAQHARRAVGAQRRDAEAALADPRFVLGRLPDGHAKGGGCGDGAQNERPAFGADRVTRGEHRPRRRIGMDDAQTDVREDDGDGERIESRLERRSNDGSDVEQLADRHRPQKVRDQQPRRLDLGVLDLSRRWPKEIVPSEVASRVKPIATMS